MKKDKLDNELKQYIKSSEDKEIRKLFKTADEGVYEDGLLGTGWYHYSTSADEVFIGHPGEIDVFVYDMNVSSTGATSPNYQGNDIIFWPGPVKGDAFIQPNSFTYDPVTFDILYTASPAYIGESPEFEFRYEYPNPETGARELLAILGTVDFI